MLTSLSTLVSGVPSEVGHGDNIVTAPLDTGLQDTSSHICAVTLVITNTVIHFLCCTVIIEAIHTDNTRVINDILTISSPHEVIGRVSTLMVSLWTWHQALTLPLMLVI